MDGQEVPSRVPSPVGDVDSFSTEDEQNDDRKVVPRAVNSFAEISSPMDVSSLADLFQTLHSATSVYVREQSAALSEHEEKAQRKRRAFQEQHDALRSFLQEFVPEAELPDVEMKARAEVTARTKTEQELVRDHFTERLLPKFLRFVRDDRRALQDASDLLGTFVQAHFPRNRELLELLEKPKPVVLFRTVLRILVAALGVRPESRKGGELQSGGHELDAAGDRAQRSDVNEGLGRHAHSNGAHKRKRVQRQAEPRRLGSHQEDAQLRRREDRGCKKSGHGPRDELADDRDSVESWGEDRPADPKPNHGRKRTFRSK